jgi:hypothetical protein
MNAQPMTSSMPLKNKLRRLYASYVCHADFDRHWQAALDGDCPVELYEPMFVFPGGPGGDGHRAEQRV